MEGEQKGRRTEGKGGEWKENGREGTRTEGAQKGRRRGEGGGEGKRKGKVVKQPPPALQEKKKVSELHMQGI